MVCQSQLYSDVADAPGPGAYYNSGVTSFASQVGAGPSWGKRGTGGFASVTKRFVVVNSQMRVGPGPAKYNVTSEECKRARAPEFSANKQGNASFIPTSDTGGNVTAASAIPGPGITKIRNDAKIRYIFIFCSYVVVPNPKAPCEKIL
jgi:hypothetical protein